MFGSHVDTNMKMLSSSIGKAKLKKLTKSAFYYFAPVFKSWIEQPKNSNKTLIV